MGEHRIHGSVEERLVGGYTGRLLTGTAFGQTTSTLALFVIPPLLPAITSDLGISPFLAGIALSVMWAMSAFAQYPGGRASDQLSRKTVMTAALGMLLIGGLVLTGSASYVVFLVGAGAVGLGAGLYWPTAFALLADLFAERRGQAFGINAAAGDLGGLLAAGLAGGVLAAMWRLAFVPIVIGIAVAVLLLHWLNRERYTVRRIDLGLRQTARHLVETSHIRLTLVAFALFLFVWQGLTGFIPTFLQVEKGFSPALANNTFAILFVTGLIGKPIAGRLGDRIGHMGVAAGAAVTATLGVGLLLLAEGRIQVIGTFALSTIGLAAIWPVIMASVMNRFPTADMGGDLGGFRTVSTAIGSVGPAYVGFVAERATFSTAFWGFVVCLLAVIGLTVWLARTTPTS